MHKRHPIRYYRSFLRDTCIGFVASTIQTRVDTDGIHDEYPNENQTRDFNFGPPKSGDCIVCHRRDDKINHTISHKKTYWNWVDMNFHMGTICSTRCLYAFSDIEKTSLDACCLDVGTRSKTSNKTLAPPSRCRKNPDEDNYQ